PRGRKLVRGDDRIRSGDEESVLGRGERKQGFGLGRGRNSSRGRLRGLRLGGRRWRKPCGNCGSRTQEEMTTCDRTLVRCPLLSAPVFSRRLGGCLLVSHGNLPVLAAPWLEAQYG